MLRRRRLRIALTVIFCLLFQQAALAAYLCPGERMPAEAAEMAAHCAEKGMDQARDNPALCAKHCNPDHTITAADAKLSVPPLALPPPAVALVYAPPVSHVVLQADVPICRSDPPPRLRFCSLLI